MKKKWISRPEAAAILGVHPQSISNYAAKGLIHENRRGSYLRYPREEVEALNTFPEIHSIEEMRSGIEKMRTEMETEYAAVKKLYDDRRALFLEPFGGWQKWENYRRIVRQLAEMAAGNTMLERQKEIFLCVLDLKSYQEIADAYGLSRERVRQIFEKSLRRILEFREIATRRLEESQRKVLELSKEIDHLHDEIFFLQHPQDNKKEEELSDKNDIFRQCEPFTLPLKELYLSVRTWNCLKYAGVRTLGDIVAYNRAEFMRIRNFGRKSLNELDILLEKRGLEFKMWTNPEYPKLDDLYKREYA